ncbi:MAG: agmatine deiminase family protein [Campylobacterota bacterium]|nr:agmatine deiminase family protein [Campylobacterota bacterium]
MKRLIAEFEEQSFTQIIFPHAQTDWNEYLEEAQLNFINIINEIIKYQKCLVICDNIAIVKSFFKDNRNLFFVEYTTDDTWARDCSAISIVQDTRVKLLDFNFNAWGDKFDSVKDNGMSRNISPCYSVKLQAIPFILEGGAIESNGANLLLTTSTCMLNKNRNPNLNKEQINQKLKDFFGEIEVLYLNHGYLAGDDTDSHVDTLARFLDAKSIAYVTCEDKNDEHYKELKLMQKELQNFAKLNDLTLVKLPMPDAIQFKKERLPASYANFLFVNGAVLIPTYGVKQDKEALDIFKATCIGLDIIGIDCSTLVKQHGSLHCVTMNFANGIGIKQKDK